MLKPYMHTYTLHWVDFTSHNNHGLEIHSKESEATELFLSILYSLKKSCLSSPMRLVYSLQGIISYTSQSYMC